MSNIFEQAVRLKVRFATQRGDMNLEDLYDLPLTSRSNPSLDGIARTISQELKQTSEESFVTPAVKTNAVLELKFELVKHVIAVRCEERDAKSLAASKKAEREKIMELIADKQDDELKSLSVEQLQAKLAE